MKVLVKQVSTYVYDVFADTGWDSWLRVRRNHWGLSSLNNVPIDREFSGKLNKLLEALPHGSLESVEVV